MKNSLTRIVEHIKFVTFNFSVFELVNMLLVFLGIELFEVDGFHFIVDFVGEVFEHFTHKNVFKVFWVHTKTS